MADVVRNFDDYHRSGQAWALGRLVVPVARLAELSDAVGALATRGDSVWRVSALVGDDAPSDAAAVRAWNAEHAHRLVVDAVEVRASSVGEIARVTDALHGTTTFVEIPVADDPDACVRAVGRGGARAKIRTGGIVAEAFPSPAHLARFLVRCVQHGVPFKATAGLHHPISAEYRLTYASNAPRGRMFGFLNVFLAAAFARAGMDDARLVQLLGEGDVSTFGFDAERVTYREDALTTRQLAEARANLAISFGSCSFREPIDDLHQLALL